MQFAVVDGQVKNVCDRDRNASELHYDRDGYRQPTKVTPCHTPPQVPRSSADSTISSFSAKRALAAAATTFISNLLRRSLQHSAFLPFCIKPFLSLLSCILIPFAKSLSLSVFSIYELHTASHAWLPRYPHSNHPPCCCHILRSLPQVSLLPQGFAQPGRD